ncbi:conserved hypothetical protein, partial [Segatella baroniae B14]
MMDYNDLNDIKLKKELLRNEILKDNQKIEKLWGKLFHKAPLSTSKP